MVWAGGTTEAAFVVVVVVVVVADADAVGSSWLPSFLPASPSIISSVAVSLSPVAPAASAADQRV